MEIIKKNMILRNCWRWCKHNAKKILEVFNGKDGALLNIISLNVAGGLIVLDQFDKINDSYEFAKKHILSGKVQNYYNTLKKWVF